MRWRVIDGCPCPASIAPYVYIVLRHADQTAAAIYRGENPHARRILNAHGKHTQGQLVHATAAQRAAWGIQGTPNPVGHSEHELFDDAGRPLGAWQVGIDSGSNSEHDKHAIEHSARVHGWRVHHPYNSVVEGHHWQFSHKPRPHSARMRLRILRLRATLPRR